MAGQISNFEFEPLDCEEAEEAKAVWMEAQQYRDQNAIERLRAEGFCFAVLETDNEAEVDFLIFLDGLADLRNLVVSAPQHSLDQVRTFFSELPSWRFEDGMRVEILETFCPDVEAWLSFKTEVVFRNDGEFVLARDRSVLPDQCWVHCADLKIIRGGEDFELRVIHINQDRDSIGLSLFAPQALVPKRVIYEW